MSSLTEIDIARSAGLHIPDDVRIVIEPEGLPIVPKNAYATYFSPPRQYATRHTLTWNDLLHEGAIRVMLRSDVAGSDEAIAVILRHKLHEIEKLRSYFLNDGSMTAGRFYWLTSEGIPGNLHSDAWDKANELQEALRKK